MRDIIWCKGDVPSGRRYRLKEVEAPYLGSYLIENSWMGQGFQTMKLMKSFLET